uniref:CDGSH iron-sulfur domain-containing protein 2 n=1 Tax=Pavo cristatus TaxID=9049 RepID=A0A8C9FFG4_PAVCR
MATVAPLRPGGVHLRCPLISLDAWGYRNPLLLLPSPLSLRRGLQKGRAAAHARCGAACVLCGAGAMGLGHNGVVRAEWIAAVSLAAGAAAVGYLAYKKFLSKDKCCKAMVNLHIQKDNPKVVHAFDMEDLGDKAVYCRCWRSKKFPLCDGSHTQHNDETGDNVGPLIIKRKEA